MPHPISVFAVVLLALLALAGLLHLFPRLGAPGRAVSGWAARAPGLDLVVFLFIAGPLIAGPAAAGWWGLLAAVAAQVVAAHVWTAAHELTHASAWRGPRIVKSLNRIVGAWRNYAGLWITVPAAPGFIVVRLMEYVAYVPLTWVVGLPKYRDDEWVNVSRQKFAGLVGHDRLWCLYCDWMTGVWSLGSEMLRNVESFWCPIRFASEGKCDRCALDFPDLDGRHGGGRWVDAGGSMADVARVLEEQYAHTRPRAWFGHPTRLTVGGRPTAGEPRA